MGCPKCGSFFEFAKEVSTDIKEVYCGDCGTFLGIEIKKVSPKVQRC